jgi:hypothetical protein
MILLLETSSIHPFFMGLEVGSNRADQCIVNARADVYLSD